MYSNTHQPTCKYVFEYQPWQADRQALANAGVQVAAAFGRCLSATALGCAHATVSVMMVAQPGAEES